MSEIAAYYDVLAEQHGFSYKSADASSEESLLARYQVLSEVVPDLKAPKTILEVGCGVGALGLALRESLNDEIFYTGIDFSQKIIEVANAEVNRRELARFGSYLSYYYKHADLMDWEEPADIVLAQGILYKQNGEQAIIDAIDKMFDLAKEALAFTAIHTMDEPSQEDGAWEPCAVYSKDAQGNSEYRLYLPNILQDLYELTDKIVLRTDYWKGDCCIYMYK